MAKSCYICKKALSLFNSGYPLSTDHADKLVCDNCHEKMVVFLKKDVPLNTMAKAKMELMQLAGENTEVKEVLSEVLDKRINDVQGVDENIQQQLTITSEQLENLERRRSELKEEFDAFVYKMENEIPLYHINGYLGREIKVFEDRVIVITNVTLGSVLTNNATDGEKTIFYSDIIGVQYKLPGITVGYLQLETASGQMNNLQSNAFSENTFTFDIYNKEIEEMKNFILWQVSKRKR